MSSIIERNNVHVIGQGKQVMMLAHGFGCDQKMWQYVTPELEKDYKIILFDYVGSGESDLSAYDSEKYSTLHGYVQDILDIIEALKLKDIVFIGHSISSMIGMLTATEYPEHFKSMIMIGPSACYLNDGDYHGGFERSDIMELLDMMEMNFAGWARYMAPLVMDQSKGQGPVNELEKSFVSTDPRVARQFAEVTFFSDNRASVTLMEVPTLVIQCSEDSIVPIEAGQYLHENLPSSEMHIMEAKGHYPHISKPEETLELIRGYLE